ncbi:MAG TPA: outer membrane beta-barrel protein [Candidatus Angelobacter sp.]
MFLCSTTVLAQDSPGRFEVGGGFTAAHTLNTENFGPAVEGDINFGRHLALDGAYSWLPGTSEHVMTGFFGAKAGVRTEHFGIFAKVRPGFISFGREVREINIIFGPGLTDISSSFRVGRQTERALDLGGVMEYYPARHWALRWDFGDMLVFQEPGPTENVTVIGNGLPGFISFPPTPSQTSNNFQFSTGVHYRF